MAERSPTARLAQARFAGLPPLVGPSGTSPPNRRLSARAPESEHADDWTPRRPSYSTSTRTPASTPGLRSATYRPKGGPERHSGDVTMAGLTMLRPSAPAGELRHATSTMGLTPSALQRLSASGEAPGDLGDVPADGGSRRKPSGPTTRCSVLAAVRSRGARCSYTARPAPPLALPAAPTDTELSRPEGPLHFLRLCHLCRTSLFALPCITRPTAPTPPPPTSPCAAAEAAETA